MLISYLSDILFPSFLSPLYILTALFSATRFCRLCSHSPLQEFAYRDPLSLPILLQQFYPFGWKSHAWPLGHLKIWHQSYFDPSRTQAMACSQAMARSQAMALIKEEISPRSEGRGYRNFLNFLPARVVDSERVSNSHNASLRFGEVYVTQFQQECFHRTYFANPHLGEFKTFPCCVYNPAAATRYLSTRKNWKKADCRWARVMFSSNPSRKLSRKVNRDKAKNDSSKQTLQVSIYCSPSFLPCSHTQPSCCFMLPQKMYLPWKDTTNAYSRVLAPSVRWWEKLLPVLSQLCLSHKHRTHNAHLPLEKIFYQPIVTTWFKKSPVMKRQQDKFLGEIHRGLLDTTMPPLALQTANRWRLGNGDS